MVVASFCILSTHVCVFICVFMGYMTISTAACVYLRTSLEKKAKRKRTANVPVSTSIVRTIDAEIHNEISGSASALFHIGEGSLRNGCRGLLPFVLVVVGLR